MPGIELLLQAITLGKQFTVLRGQIMKERIDASPEGLGVDAGARERLLVDETVQFGGYAGGGDA